MKMCGRVFRALKAFGAVWSVLCIVSNLCCGECQVAPGKLSKPPFVWPLGGLILISESRDGGILPGEIEQPLVVDYRIGSLAGPSFPVPVPVPVPGVVYA